MTTRRQIITGAAAMAALAILPAAAIIDPLPDWTDEGLRGWMAQLPDRQRQQAETVEFCGVYQAVCIERAEAENEPLWWKHAADHHEATARLVHEDIPRFDRTTANVRQALAARGLS